VRALLKRVAPAWFLFLFAPISAEYLIGYDDTTGNAAALIFGLVIFGPLYGAPAVLIREFTRRARRGWPTMLLLGLAFGLVQAGLVDQSLFNPDYRSIPYWDSLRQPTLIPGAGTSAAIILSFLGTHMVGSICAPIALAESLVPGRSRSPWLGSVGLAVMAVLWLIGAGFVLSDTFSEETFRPSVVQVGVSALVVVALTVVAFTRPRVEPPSTPPQLSANRAPSPVLVLVVATLCLSVRPLLDSLTARTAVAGGWVPTLIGLGALVILGILLSHWSRRDGWSGRHVLAVATGALVGIAGIAFTVEPLGHVSATAKYTSNAVLLALVLGLVALASSRLRRMPASVE